MTQQHVKSIGRILWVWWALATIVGIIIGALLASAIGQANWAMTIQPSRRFIVWALEGAMLGAGVGIMQWFVLRQQISKGGWWVLASIVGIANAAVILSLFPAEAPWVVSGISIIILGAIVGIAQWLVLWWQTPKASLWIIVNILGVTVAGVLGIGVMGENIVGVVVSMTLFGVITGGALNWLLGQPAI